MPSPSSSAKRPGILSWVLYGLVVLIAVAVVGSMVTSTLRPYLREESGVATQSSGISLFPSKAGIPAMMPGADYAYDDGSLARESMPSPLPPMQGGSAAVDLDGNPVTPRVIKTAELTLRVSDAPKTVEDIRTYVGAKEGFVESSSLSDSGSGPRSAVLTLRVPVDSFEEVMRGLKAFASLVVYENVYGQDVTAEFVDLEADLRNAKAEEASYLEILKRTGDIEDVLAVTKQLADVRGRIERLEGRKRYLSNRTDLATIAVTLTEDTRVEAPTPTWRPFEVLKESIHDLIVALQELVNFLIRLVVGLIGLLLPIALLVGLLVWVGWKIAFALLKRLRK